MAEHKNWALVFTTFHLLVIFLIIAHVRLNKCALGHTHTCPRCPLPCRSTNVPPPLSPTGPHSHCSSLTPPEHAWDTRSTECDLYFYPHLFHLLITFLSCSLVPVIYETVADFSTAFYADIVCCWVSEFKVNPPQTVTAMSVLSVWAHARASVLYSSPPLPTVPEPTKRAVLERSHSNVLGHSMVS